LPPVLGKLAGPEAAPTQDVFPGNGVPAMGAIFGRRGLDLARPEDTRLAETVETWREHGAKDRS
jgi:hypothetical protein